MKRIPRIDSLIDDELDDLLFLSAAQPFAKHGSSRSNEPAHLDAILQIRAGEAIDDLFDPLLDRRIFHFEFDPFDQLRTDSILMITGHRD